MGMWIAHHLLSVDKIVFYFLGTFSLGFICGCAACITIIAAAIYINNKL